MRKTNPANHILNIDNKRSIVFIVLFFAFSLCCYCQILQHRPYDDLRHWHLGFNVGTNIQDISFAFNSADNEQEQLYASQRNFTPGFNVGLLADYRLSQWFNLRFSPTLILGDREITFRGSNSGEKETFSLKSTYIATPFDLKYSSLRFRNVRPYLSAGIMPAFSIARKKSTTLKLNPTDIFITAAIGSDFYLPFFKLIAELKFCFGLTDCICKKRPEFADDPNKLKYTQTIRKATASMVILTFFFE